MQLLSELDGFAKYEDIIFLAATNREDVLDPAILRPGRFDRVIRFDMPDQDAREMILQIHARGMNLKDVNFGVLARKTDGFSGAQIKALVTEAGIKALREEAPNITQKHFNEALAELKDETAIKNYIYS
jgi:proteasome regulatory subunit